MLKKIITVFLFTLIIISYASAQDLPKEVIFVSEDKENFPQQIGNSTEYNMDRPGVAVDFIKKLEPIVNIKIIFKRMPWKRCLEDELMNSKADGAFLASYKKEREEFGLYPMKNGKPDTDKRVVTTSYVFCRLKGSKVDWDGKQIVNLKKSIGAPLGYSIVGDLKNMGYDVVEADDALKGVKLLILERIDLFTGLDSQLEYILKINPEMGQKVEILPIPVMAKPYYLMLSKKFVAENPVLANKIWDTIRTIRDTEYKKLEEKYYK